MKTVMLAMAAVFATALVTAAASGADPSWESWNSDRGQMALRFDGDLLIGQAKDNFMRFELHSAGKGVWKGSYAVASTPKPCGEEKLGGLPWGNLTVTFDAKRQKFTAKSDFCGTDKDPKGVWTGAMAQGD
jgi:hypothetical protein